MKHMRTVTRRPSPAQEPTIGDYLTLVVNLLSVIATALTTKEAAT